MKSNCGFDLRVAVAKFFKLIKKGPIYFRAAKMDSFEDYKVELAKYRRLLKAKTKSESMRAFSDDMLQKIKTDATYYYYKRNNNRKKKVLNDSKKLTDKSTLIDKSVKLLDESANSSSLVTSKVDILPPAEKGEIPYAVSSYNAPLPIGDHEKQSKSGPGFDTEDFDYLVALQCELDGEDVDPIFLDFKKLNTFEVSKKFVNDMQNPVEPLSLETQDDIDIASNMQFDEREMTATYVNAFYPSDVDNSEVFDMS